MAIFCEGKYDTEMTMFVKDKSANILNFLAMNRIVTQFSQTEEDNDQPAGRTLNISNDVFADFFCELNEREVHYLAVGHIAGAYHGCPKICGGIELWLAHDHENEKKVLDLLQLGGPLNTTSLGQEVNFQGEVFTLTTYYQMLHYSHQEFYSCYSDSESAIVMNAEIPILSMKDFICEKLASSTSEDRKIIDTLENPCL